MKVLALIGLVTLPISAIAGHPDCSGIERWATKMAFVHLKNADVTDNQTLDWEQTKTVRLASEKIGNDLYRQVHRITFSEHGGKKIEAITVNDASSEECSMTGVDVFLISKQLGGQ